MEFIPAKSLIIKTKNTSWFGIDYNMNIYKGCCHGCIYCDSRRECYQIDNFDIVRAKENALQIIRDELRRKVKTGVIGTGAMSDPYNPFEKDEKLTRHSLELINAFQFGVGIATKSDLVTRDVDILQEIKEHSPVIVKVTITTADDQLCKKIEPFAPESSKRFSAIRELAQHGIFTGILLMPVLPYINDNEANIKEIIRLAYENGAKFIYPAFGVTLSDRQRTWYYNELDKKFPNVKEKYIQKYGTYYQCSSPNAKKLWSFFAKECNRYGIYYTMSDIVMAYKRGYRHTQLTMFDYEGFIR